MAIIRTGQRTPFRKATNKEVQDRTEWIALKLAISPNLKEGELKRIIKERFNLKWQQALEYISRAKQLLQERANITKEHAKQIGINKLLDTIQNGTPGESNAAIRLWTEIFGNAAPTQHRIGNPDGTEIKTVIAPTVQFVLPAKRDE